VATDLREGPARPSLRKALKFERHELPALLGVLGFVTLLHVLGWGLFIYYNSQPSFHRLTDSHGALIYAGAGALAYGFGLRHAFDADHISAIDDTTRLMLAKGKKPLGVGLFFSLGHSSIVLAMSEKGNRVSAFLRRPRWHDWREYLRFLLVLGWDSQPHHSGRDH
jgi:high-affinity nickel permease